jgi:hypothetical protein
VGVNLNELIAFFLSPRDPATTHVVYPILLVDKDGLYYGISL